MNREQLRAFLILLFVVVLMVGSLVSMIATIAFGKRMSDETAHVLFGLIPLEFCILFFGSCFLLCLSFFLVV